MDDKKIVFEIQCSSISQQELEKRTQDYLSIGYRPVWILHDRIFNKKILTPQETFLLNHPHYFTNTERLSPVFIYDQLQISFITMSAFIKVLKFQCICIEQLPHPIFHRFHFTFKGGTPLSISVMTSSIKD